MIHKAITLKFVVPTVLATALAIVVSVGAVKYLVPIDQAEANHSAPAAAKFLNCQTLTGSFRAFACCFPV